MEGQGELFEEPMRRELRPMDGPWSVGPAPHRWRYMLLGEDWELMMVEGHGVRAGHVPSLLRHAGVGWDTPDDDVDGLENQMTYTWAARVTTCPDHPRWLRVVARPLDWVRWRIWALAWKVWLHREPLREWWTPGWWKRTREWLRRVVHCDICDGAEPDGDPLWTWDTHGCPADANRGRPEYRPVTLVDLEG